MANPWEIYDYEVMMFQGTEPPVVLPNPCPISPVYQNAFVESRLLHTRILCDILLSRGSEKDDIRLNALLPGFTSSSIDQLDRDYGRSHIQGTPCWELNKHLAHATNLRADSHDYGPMLQLLKPTMLRLIEEVATEKKKKRGI